MFNLFNKTNYRVQIFIIIITGITLWLPGFINPVIIQKGNNLTPLYNISIQILQSWKPLVTITGLIFLFLLSFSLNNTLVKHDIIIMNNYLPAFLVVLLGSWHSTLLTFHPALPAALLLLTTANNFLTVSIKDEAFNNLFYIGFSIALASMFYFPAIIFFIIIPIGFIAIKIFSLRAWLLAFTGFFFPYVCLTVWYFCIDKLEIIIKDYLYYFSNLSFINIKIDNSFLFYVLCIPLCLLIIFSVFKVLTTLINKNISVRRALILITWFVILSVAGLFTNSKNVILHSIIILFPVITFVAQFINSIRKKIIKEIAFCFIIMFTIFFRFFVR
jgi:hypothetical protein